MFNFQQECFENEKNHGFHDGSKLTGLTEFTEKDINAFYRKVALLHTEISELVESFRDGTIYTICDKWAAGCTLNFGAEELGDILIRLFTLAEFLNIDLLNSAQIKHEFNKTRPFLHGKNS